MQPGVVSAFGSETIAHASARDDGAALPILVAGDERLKRRSVEVEGVDASLRAEASAAHRHAS